MIQSIWHEWLEFRENQARGQAAKGRRIVPEPPKQWQPPEEGTLKLNVSSFVEEHRINIRIGIIARDHVGRIVQAWSVTRDGSSNPVVAKVEASRVVLVGSTK